MIPDNKQQKPCKFTWIWMRGKERGGGKQKQKQKKKAGPSKDRINTIWPCWRSKLSGQRISTIFILKLIINAMLHSVLSWKPLFQYMLKCRNLFTHPPFHTPTHTHTYTLHAYEICILSKSYREYSFLWRRLSPCRRDLISHTHIYQSVM